MQRIAKITGKLAAQARRDLQKSSEQADSVPVDLFERQARERELQPLTKEQLRKLASR